MCIDSGLQLREKFEDFKYGGSVFIIRICSDTLTNDKDGYYIKTFRIDGVNEIRYPLQSNLEYDFQAHINQALTHDDLNGEGTYDKKQIENIQKMIADKMDAEA